MRALVRTTPEAGAEQRPGLFRWWLNELEELLPRGRGAARGGGGRRAALQLVLERPFVRVLARRGRALQQVGTFLLPEERQGDGGIPRLEPELHRALDRRKGSATLVLGPDDALTCTDLLPISAEAELNRIVAHKIDLLTPWPAERVYAAHRVVGRRADGMLEVLLAVAPRTLVDETRRRLAAAGIDVAAVDVLREDGHRTAEVDLLRADAPGTAGRRGWLRAAAALLLALVVAGAGWGGWEIWQRRQQLAAQQAFLAGLERRLADLPALRERVSARQAEAGFLAAERRSRPSPLIVLEVLSRLLPDSVWLTDIRLEERELTIAGMAEDAAALIALIEGAPELAQARFQTPSTRVRVATGGDGEREVERFAISAVVDPAVEPSL